MRSWIIYSPVAQLVKNPLQCMRPGFDPWVGKIPWRRERLPTPVFWLGEFHGLYSPCDCKELETTEWLSLSDLGLKPFPKGRKVTTLDISPKPSPLFSTPSVLLGIPAQLSEFLSQSCSVISDSLQPHGLYSPWNSPSQNTGVGSLSLLQGTF